VDKKVLKDIGLLDIYIMNIDTQKVQSYTQLTSELNFLKLPFTRYPAINPSDLLDCIYKSTNCPSFDVNSQIILEILRTYFDIGLPLENL